MEERLQHQKIPKLLFTLAIPSICGQIVTLIYNMVDRMYIGRLPDGALAMAAIGLCVPLTTIITAFNGLFGRGGAPLSSILLGEKKKKEANNILTTSFICLVITSFVITTVVWLFQDPLLYLFGVNHETIQYARDYISIYALGTIFIQLTVGLNYFVNAQKYPLQFNVVETLLKTVRQQLPIAVQEPENYEARATMLWAASWSLNSFCTSGFQTQPSLHTLEQFSATYDMTHGLALAIIMPQWMKYLLDRDETVIDDFARFGVNVMGIEASDNKKIDAYQTIKALQSFIQDELGLPMFLSQLKIDDTKFKEMAVKACGGQEIISRAYRPLTQEDCFNIYKMCL